MFSAIVHLQNQAKMGHGACTHEVSRTETTYETGQKTITKTIVTKCGCKKLQPSPHKNGFYGEGHVGYKKETCDTCGHTHAYH